MIPIILLIKMYQNIMIINDSTFSDKV